MFKVGQKVVCILDDNRDGWYSCITGEEVGGPVYGEELIVQDIDQYGLLFKGYYPEGYLPEYFRPAQEDFAEETLKETKIQQLEHRIEELERKLEEQVELIPLKKL